LLSTTGVPRKALHQYYELRHCPLPRFYRWPSPRAKS